MKLDYFFADENKCIYLVLNVQRPSDRRRKNKINENHLLLTFISTHFYVYNLRNFQKKNQSILFNIIKTVLYYYLTIMWAIDEHSLLCSIQSINKIYIFLQSTELNMCNAYFSWKTSSPLTMWSEKKNCYQWFCHLFDSWASFTIRGEVKVFSIFPHIRVFVSIFALGMSIVACLSLKKKKRVYYFSLTVTFLLCTKTIIS